MKRIMNPLYALFKALITAIALLGCNQAKTESASVDSVYQEPYVEDTTMITVLPDTSIAKSLAEADNQDMVEQKTEEIETEQATSLEKTLTPKLKPLFSTDDSRTISRLPRRIDCQVTDRVVKGEVGVYIDLFLLDSTETKTVANKDFSISINVTYFAVKESLGDSIVFKKGDDILRYAFQAKYDGPVRITFTNKELMGAEMLLRSVNQKKQTGYLNAKTSIFRFTNFQLPQPLVLVIPPTIFYKANGKQEAQISYLLDDASNSWPETAQAKINIIAPEGILSSNSILVDRNSIGTVTLKSEQPGEIKVRSHSATPGVKIDPTEVSIKFIKDIDSFDVLMPDSLHLLEEGELVINLKSTGGGNITTDHDLTYSVAVEGSALQVEPKTGIIKTNQPGARLRVIPVAIGSSKVTLSIENYLDQSATSKIKFPTFLIFVAMFAGLLGGGLSLFMNNREKNLWKIALAVITGPMLMWLSLYLGIGSLSPRLILNPISCFLIAFLGGWAGVAVINQMLKIFGLTQTAAPAVDDNGRDNAQ